jgi:hypothetical protein
MDRFAVRRAQRDLEWRLLLENAECPYELVPGTQAQAALEAARVLGRKESFSPLVVLPSGAGGGISTGPMNLRDSEVPKAAEYFERKTRALVERAAREWTDWDTRACDVDPDGLSLFDHVSEVTLTDARDQFYSHQLCVTDELSETRPISPYAEVALFRLPCADSWKIP